MKYRDSGEVNADPQHPPQRSQSP